MVLHVGDLIQYNGVQCQVLCESDDEGSHYYIVDAYDQIHAFADLPKGADLELTDLEEWND